MEAIWSSFLLVAASEFGDKTQLLAFALAAKYRKPWPILAGIFVATIFNHLLAAGAGHYLSHYLTDFVLKIILSVSFFIFAIWTLKPDKLDDSNEEKYSNPFIATLILFFLAEMGDKTQLATLALGARFQDTALVTLGTTLGMMVTDGLAVFIGDRLVKSINLKYMRWFTACLFFIFALMGLISLI